MALAGKWVFGWMQHPWVASSSHRGEGTSYFLLSSAKGKGQKRDVLPQREGAEEGCEPGEWGGRQKEAKPKRWKVTI